jgi:prevent-host-death family protein
MPTFNIYEAKTHLSQLLQRVADGEEVVIARAGKPVAKLVPYSETRPRREPGGWQGKVRIGADFDKDLPDEIAAAFRGERA